MGRINHLAELYLLIGSCLIMGLCFSFIIPRVADAETAGGSLPDRGQIYGLCPHLQKR